MIIYRNYLKGTYSSRKQIMYSHIQSTYILLKWFSRLAANYNWEKVPQELQSDCEAITN